MLQQASRRIGQAALMAILIAVSAWVLADEKSSVAPQRKNSNPARTSGVIVKVEPVEQGDQASKRIWRVTVNTDVVWRDFVRDQAVDPSKAARTGTERAAAKGKKSVAAEGHPRAEAMSATVNLNPKTEITDAIARPPMSSARARRRRKMLLALRTRSTPAATPRRDRRRTARTHAGRLSRHAFSSRRNSSRGSGSMLNTRVIKFAGSWSSGPWAAPTPRPRKKTNPQPGKRTLRTDQGHCRGDAAAV